MKESMSERITVRLDGETALNIDIMNKATNTPKAQIIRMILRDFFAKNEELLQYLYDYGIKDTCKLLHITEEEFNSILEPSKREYSHHKYNYQISEIKPLIAKDISDNYNRLRSKFIGNTTNLQLSQTDEDIFHNTLLKVISDGM